MHTGKKYFVRPGSIVRTIWGKSDTILFIFSGSAAEFALNKAVDWLYFTGRLPADPIGRLFSTVSYARLIIFSELEDAHKAIDKITAIHAAVEKSRAASIPDWAYRDVLFMLIYYSIAAYELLERKLTDIEKEELFDVFYRVGCRMHLKELPVNYHDWQIDRASHMQTDLLNSAFTTDLYRQYRKHLGAFRYKVLLESQKLVVPHIVGQLLNFSKIRWLKTFVPIYKLSKKIKLDELIKAVLLPVAYKEQIKALDQQ